MGGDVLALLPDGAGEVAVRGVVALVMHLVAQTQLILEPRRR